MKKVPILLTLFIFASFTPALCDSVKSVKGAEDPDTAKKMDKNAVPLRKKAEPAKKTTEWTKKDQSGDVDFLRTLEAKKRSEWLESPDKVIASLEFSENVLRNQFLNPPPVRAIKSTSSYSAKSVLPSFRNGNGSLEEGSLLPPLRLLQSKEQIFLFKEIFMGLRLSFDPTGRRMLLEMNVAPATEATSGFMIRF